MLAVIIQRSFRLPGMPDRANRADIIAHPRGRRCPGNAIAALVMTFNLGAEAKVEALIRELV